MTLDDENTANLSNIAPSQAGSIADARPGARADWESFLGSRDRAADSSKW